MQKAFDYDNPLSFTVESYPGLQLQRFIKPNSVDKSDNFVYKLYDDKRKSWTDVMQLIKQQYLPEMEVIKLCKDRILSLLKYNYITMKKYKTERF